MLTQNRVLYPALLTATLLSVMAVGPTRAQSQRPSPKSAPPEISTSNDSDTAVQDQLLKLLRLSPTLTTVVARDPSLLSDQEYVARNSPELAQFLQAHPEVIRNPNFYLFSNLNRGRRGRAEEALERKIWPDLTPAPSEPSPTAVFIDRSLTPMLAFIGVTGALLWLIHMLLQNRRWSRIFRLQTEVHTRLIERFGSNQELLTYMGTDAGKRFLEAAPIPVEFEQTQRFPSAVSKVLMPLQIGIVLTLLGGGLLLLRSSVPEASSAMLVFGVVVLMPGLGFIISAGITWLLAGKLGLMPNSNSSSQIAAGERQ